MALTIAQDTVALAQTLLVRDGKTPERLRDLSVSHNKLGDVAQALGRLDEAELAYAKEVQWAKELVASYGETVSALEVLAYGLKQLGQLLEQRGDRVQAQDCLAQARVLYQRLALAMPHEQRYQIDWD